ncbi:hypothetical protein [Rosistilla oblonga]|uniref:hypothetical protein n=1 Tax=Rosistilla oblonga TaxID=2527990 RepID=UPI003A96E9E8
MPRRRIWLILAVVASILAGLLHQPLFSAVTRCYRSSDPIDESSITHLYLLDGDRLLETAITMAPDGKPILIPQEATLRSVQCGAAPSPDEVMPQLLLELGAAPGQTELVPGAAWDDYQRIEYLGQWMDQNPDAVVCMLAEALASGRLRRIVDRKFTDQAASRLKIKPLDPIDHSADRWWRSTTGCKEFYGQSIAWLYDWISPNGTPRPDDMSPQEYEDAFRQRLRSLGVRLSDAPPQPELSPQGAS